VNKTFFRRAGGNTCPYAIGAATEDRQRMGKNYPFLIAAQAGLTAIF
jgi:hypothetical protein